MSAIPFVESFATLATGYDAVLSDVWGVIHNGVAATPEPCDALMRFRAKGGTVALITNAPRPGAVVTQFLDKLDVPREAYDTIVSSGDVTRAVIAKRPGKTVFHIGPERDLGIFEGLDLRFVPLEQADYVVCTGLTDDETETPESYRALLTKVRERKLFMICGNPDLVVERGDRLVYCAGAIADLYGETGRRGALRRQAASADLPRVLARSRRCAARTAARTRAGDRRFGAHRSDRRR